MLKVYFAGSIRGGRADADLYRRMIQHIQRQGAMVLTEHVGNPMLLQKERELTDAEIYRQDTTWLVQSDILIAECSTPSLGVGYELAFAEAHGKPCHLFYRRTIHLSGMLAGNKYFVLHPYDNAEDIFPILDMILTSKGND